jgi:hypothetical protein
LAFADVLVGSWVLGVTGRWDQVGGPQGSATSPGYALQALEVGAEVGYRLRLSRVVGVEAALESGISAISQQLRSGTGNMLEATNPKTGALMRLPGRGAAVGRLGFALRSMLLASSRVDAFVALDASFDITGDRANQIPVAYAGTADLPTWSAGVSLGAQLRAWP